MISSMMKLKAAAQDFLDNNCDADDFCNALIAAAEDLNDPELLKVAASLILLKD